jgi:hypothetical protein
MAWARKPKVLFCAAGVSMKSANGMRSSPRNIRWRRAGLAAQKVRGDDAIDGVPQERAVAGFPVNVLVQPVEDAVASDRREVLESRS